MSVLQNTERVTFELSNTCPYERLHTLCPTHHRTSTTVLPTQVVSDIMEFCGKEGYSGQFFFSVYNEPLSDPRLFFLLHTMARLCPEASAAMITNGWNLTKDLMEELRSLRVNLLKVDAYTDREFDRLKEFVPDLWLVRKFQLDDRISRSAAKPIYASDGSAPPCSAPYRDIVIHSNGSVGLCCQDWEQNTSFGNVKHLPLKEILMSEDMRRFSVLNSESRFLPICMRCPWRT